MGTRSVPLLSEFKNKRESRFSIEAGFFLRLIKGKQTIFQFCNIFLKNAVIGST